MIVTNQETHDLGVQIQCSRTNSMSGVAVSLTLMTSKSAFTLHKYIILTLLNILCEAYCTIILCSIVCSFRSKFTVIPLMTNVPLIEEPLLQLQSIICNHTPTIHYFMDLLANL